MKVIIAGDRTYTNKQLVADAVRKSDFDITEVVCGTPWDSKQRPEPIGADQIGAWYAHHAHIPVKEFPYLSEHGNQGGPIRNSQMAQYADALILIWGGQSRGSADMLKKARSKKLSIFQVLVKDDGTVDYIREGGVAQLSLL